MKKILTLWDIDGNMVNVYRHHTPSYQAAIRTRYGITLLLEEIESNYGKPASEVVAIPLRSKNVPELEIQEGLQETFQVYASQLEERIRNSSKDGINPVLPGVVNILERLVAENIPRGVVTGNIRLAGDVILKATDLSKYFLPEISSYAENATKRSEIVKNSLINARRLGLYDENTAVFVFGDTPSDVEAAKANGCFSVAVIKNSNTLESSPGGVEYKKRKKILEASNPDILFDDLTETELILNKVYSLAR